LSRSSKNKLLKLSLGQSVWLAMAVLLCAVTASMLSVYYVDVSRTQQYALAQEQSAARLTEQLTVELVQRVAGEASTLVETSEALSGAARRLGTQRLILTTPNGEKLFDLAPSVEAPNLGAQALVSLTARAMEYGTSTSALAPNTASKQAPLHAVSVRLKATGNVLVAAFALTESALNAAMVGSPIKVSQLRLAESEMSILEGESILLKRQGAVLLAILVSEGSVTSLWWLIAPGLAFGAVGTILASGLLFSAVRRQNDRLNLLARVADNYVSGKAVKLTPSGHKDMISQVSLGMKKMLDVSSARERRLSKLAYRDNQTDLPNKILYLERLEALAEISAKEDEAFSVMAVRVTGLSDAIETLGPDSQNKLMQELASRFLRCLRKKDDDPEHAKTVRANATVARLDEDVFGVLLPITTVHQAQGLGAALAQNIAHQFSLDDRRITLGCQIGVGTYPTHCVAGLALHRAALAALRDAQAGEVDLHVFGQPIKATRIHKATAVAKVANNDMFDFDWDKVVS
jgi:GGDEF domain-containing protein